MKANNEPRINTYLCKKCGNEASFLEGGHKGVVTSWHCGKCGFINDNADMDQPIVKITKVH